MIETSALIPSLGVEVRGIEDLFDENVLTRCLEALTWRGVLLIRGLHLDDDQQIAFSERLGTVLSPGGQRIFEVTLDPTRNRSAEYLKGTFNWHLDDTTSAVPASATVLTARHVAMEGGQTQFASTYAAYDALPEDRRALYDDLRVVHSFEASMRRINPDPTERELKVWRMQPELETSLVWRRRDGRRSLVIGCTADHIVGMDRDEGRKLLDELLDWSTGEQFRLTHEWEVGDLVVWDNTGILHRALPYDAGSERSMKRTTIAGREPWS